MKLRFILIATIGLAYTLSSCNFSSAKIKDAKMCTSLSANLCNDDNPVFESTTAEIFVSCQLKNAPENTDIEFAWFYYGQQKISIEALSLNSGSNTGTLNLQSSINRPNNGWPLGDYEVVISILDTDKDPIIKKFSVE